MEFGLQWEELKISNDFLFAKVMRNKEICIKFLELLLQTPIDDIIYLEEQKVINPALDAKSIRLDVYVEDGKRVFDVEMQTSNEAGLAKRTRYYQGMMDMQMMEKGMMYKELKESYIIFICTFDPFQRGWAQYTFENLCTKEPDLALGDGTRKVFFNTTAYQNAEDKDIQALLQYMNGGKPTSDFTEALDNKIRLAKSNEEWRMEFMKFEVMQMDARAKGREEGIEIGLEKGREEGREEGIEIGLEKGREIGLEKGREIGQISVVRSLLDLIPDEIIAEKTGIPLEKIKEIRKNADKQS